MSRIKYDMVMMKWMSLFETITRAELKDCFVDNHQTLVFLVEVHNIGRAIGKKGANVKRLETLLNRKIKIVEFNPDLITFIRNLVAPLQLQIGVTEEGVVTFACNDAKTKGMLIGRNAQNLRNYEEIVKRYFEGITLKVKNN